MSSNESARFAATFGSGEPYDSQMRTLPTYIIDGVWEGTRPGIDAFLSSLSQRDRFDRFCSSSTASVAWLLGDLARPDHSAIIARSEADVVGLLDYVTFASSAEFGVVVDARLRRRGIARAMLAQLLTSLPASYEVLADCRRDNIAAIGFLRAGGFSVTRDSGLEVRWQRRGLLR